MPVPGGLGIAYPAAQHYYRITSLSFWTTDARKHKKVVNGAGGIRNPHGARYNYPGARTVYLTEDPPTCLAEKAFYFQKELLITLDALHLPPAPPLPAFHQRFVLWDIVCKTAISSVFPLTVGNAPTAGAFPCLLLNPSQDYWHLKQRRADIEAAGYNGLQAPSTRVIRAGNLVVLFHDQSGNLSSITPYEVEFRLLQLGGAPFALHTTQQLDYWTVEVKVNPPVGGALPATLAHYSVWRRVTIHR